MFSVLFFIISYFTLPLMISFHDRRNLKQLETHKKAISFIEFRDIEIETESVKKEVDIKADAQV